PFELPLIVFGADDEPEPERRLAIEKLRVEPIVMAERCELQLGAGRVRVVERLQREVPIADVAAREPRAAADEAAVAQRVAEDRSVELDGGRVALLERRRHPKRRLEQRLLGRRDDE